MPNPQQPQPAAEPKSGNVLLTPVLALVAVWALYTCWIVVGGLVGSGISGGFRFIATFVVAIGFPVLTALGFTSKTEEGSRGLQKINRVLGGTAAVCAATAFIIGVALAGTVVPQMHREPNWFFNPRSTGKLPQINRRYSAATANALCRTAHMVGTHYCPK